MENNENNIQNQVNETVSKPQKSGKKVTIILGIIVLILVLALGVLAGLLISGNGNKIINQVEEKVAQNDDKKTSRKIDESKDWVYDADYLNGRTDKTRENYKASRDLIAPFININSDDAKKANEEIKALYEELYSEFTENIEVTKGINQEKVVDGSAYAISKIEYEYVEKGNILSILVTYDRGAVPADSTRSYKTYNFNLDTLKYATLEEVGKVCGFNSEAEIKEKINISMENAGSEAGIFEDTVWDGKRFFINKNARLNIVLPGPALGEITLDVEKDVQRKSANKEISTNKIIKKLSPSGWAGSSMHEIRLYNNGDVYHVTYNGEGNTEENIISNELIAKNADTIEEKTNGQALEGIIVKGKRLEIVKNEDTWIIMEGSDTNSSTVNNKTNSDNEEEIFKETIWYTCDEFKIKLPKSWENNYVVEKGTLGDNSGVYYSFLCASDQESLFTIQITKNENENEGFFTLLGNYSVGNELRYVYMVTRRDAPLNPEPSGTMMSDFQDNIDDIYIKHQFGDKIIYAKDFSKIEKGSMYRYYIYYIDENDTLCVLNYENNITIEEVAQYTDKLVYNENDNKIHAYPIGGSFMNNLVYNRPIEEIVFEGRK